MPLALAAQSEPTRSTCHDRTAELRWVVRVDGQPAALHVLRAHGESAATHLAGATLAPWSSARTLAPALRWSSDVLPRVLRPGPDMEGLEIEDSAPAIQLCERGHDSDAVRVEHHLFVLAAFIDLVRPILPAAPTVRPALAGR